ncbi:deoxyhypusine monooxygenase [Pseudohyphozyma bogoriensis]|nr:deoxyhypusine monooxygenase [Pseudohyphozyma bogoriensis]
MAATTQIDENATFAALDQQLNSESTPLAQRFRALFTLKGLGGLKAIEIIGKGFEGDSALLGHELAYCLGQIHDARAIPILQKVLDDPNQHTMVRHEAAEAMGAISDLSALDILEPYLKHENDSLRETAEIAVAKIKWDNSDEGKAAAPNQYATIDPAPAATSSPLASTSTKSDLSVPELQKVLMNPSLPLFERYRAMFSLRNNGGEEAVLALATGFRDPSALFRHEIAFVFGQLCSPYSVPSLTEVLRDDKEEDMVRHEAAEALGSVGTQECLPILKEFATKEDAPRVVRESCVVALDFWEHENSGELHYTAPVVLAA